MLVHVHYECYNEYTPKFQNTNHLARCFIWQGKAFMEDNEVAPVWERPPGVGMPGQLKSITLVNFMCHEHLQMEFG